MSTPFYDQQAADVTGTKIETAATGRRAKIWRLLHRFDLVSMSGAVGIKVVMVALNFLLITLAARSLSTEAFGQYSVLFSATGLLYIFATGGQELFVVRSWSEFFANRDEPHLKGAILFTTGVAVIGSLLAAAVFLLWTPGQIGHEEVFAALAYLILMGWLQIALHAVRTELGVFKADGLTTIMSNSAPILYLVLCLLTGEAATIAGLFVTLALGSALSLSIEVTLALRQIRQKFPELSLIKANYALRTWVARSTKFWLSSALEAVNQYVDVIVISYVLDPAAAGAYFVTVRLSNLFGAAADAINIFTIRHLPGLLFRKDAEAIDRTLNNVAWLTLSLIVIGMLGISVRGYFVLGFLNSEYVHYFGALLVLCIGTCALAAARTSAITLMLTGHEGLYLAITAIFTPIRVLGVILVAPHFGVMGAVTVTAICFFAQAVVLRAKAAMYAGFDPSIFRLLKIKVQ